MGPPAMVKYKQMSLGRVYSIPKGLALLCSKANILYSSHGMLYLTVCGKWREQYPAKLPQLLPSFLCPPALLAVVYHLQQQRQQAWRLIYIL